MRTDKALLYGLKKHIPPSAVKTVRDLIYWQYAKIISHSAGTGKKKYGFIMDRFKKLQSGDIEWSGSIREYIKERETPNECIYCGSTEKPSWDHLIPVCRDIVQVIEEQNINSNAYFYTEIEASYDGEQYLRESIEFAGHRDAKLNLVFISVVVFSLAIVYLGFRFLPDD